MSMMRSGAPVPRSLEGRTRKTKVFNNPPIQAAKGEGPNWGAFWSFMRANANGKESPFPDNQKMPAGRPSRTPADQDASSYVSMLSQTIVVERKTQIE